MRWLTRRAAAGAVDRPARPRAAPRWTRPATRTTAIAAGFAAAFAGPTWLWRAGWLTDELRGAQNSALMATASIGLTVQDILVEGRVNTPRPDILAAVGLARGDPIMGFDPETVRHRLEAVPWIRTATVERRLPRTVLIRIVERRPMALWQRDGGLTLVDDEGVAITGEDLDRFDNLVVIIGRDAPAHAPALFTLLAAQPALNKRVRAAARVAARRWNLYLDNGIDVRLPEKDAPAAWARLAQLERRHSLLSRDVKMIDLRIPDRLIVRRKPPGAAGPKKNDKNT